jgi:trehalose utilization protein
VTVRVTVWGENILEREDPVVARLYPDGMHACIADALNAQPDIVAGTATFEEAAHGLTAERLAATDVLVWWGHRAHDQVADHVVERVAEQVWAGMGLVCLHSAHFSKIFRRLMGTPCALKWRIAAERERLWVVARHHPIARGLPDCFELATEEMYGEPFSVPEPLETVFISWFEGGEVFRSGLTYRRGAGKVFYFRPGHETYPTYHDPNVRLVLANAVRWAHNPEPRLADAAAAPNVPAAEAFEPLDARNEDAP